MSSSWSSKVSSGYTGAAPPPISSTEPVSLPPAMSFSKVQHSQRRGKGRQEALLKNTGKDGVIVALQTEFPDIDREVLEAVFDSSHGDYDGACRVLLSMVGGDPNRAGAGGSEEAVEGLSSSLGMDRECVQSVWESCGGDYDACYAVLLDMKGGGGVSPSVAGSSSSLPATGPPVALKEGGSGSSSRNVASNIHEVEVSRLVALTGADVDSVNELYSSVGQRYSDALSLLLGMKSGGREGGVVSSTGSKGRGVEGLNSDLHKVLNELYPSADADVVDKVVTHYTGGSGDGSLDLDSIFEQAVLALDDIYSDLDPPPEAPSPPSLSPHSSQVVPNLEHDLNALSAQFFEGHGIPQDLIVDIYVERECDIDLAAEDLLYIVRNHATVKVNVWSRGAAAVKSSIGSSSSTTPSPSPGKNRPYPPNTKNGGSSKGKVASLPFDVAYPPIEGSGISLTAEELHTYIKVIRQRLRKQYPEVDNSSAIIKYFFNLNTNLEIVQETLAEYFQSKRINLRTQNMRSVGDLERSVSDPRGGIQGNGSDDGEGWMRPRGEEERLHALTQERYAEAEWHHKEVQSRMVEVRRVAAIKGIGGALAAIKREGVDAARRERDRIHGDMDQVIFSNWNGGSSLEDLFTKAKGSSLPVKIVRVDLHGQTARTARDITESIVDLSMRHRIDKVLIVTGAGFHSSNKRTARIKPMVRSCLSEQSRYVGLTFKETEGSITVSFPFL